MHRRSALGLYLLAGTGCAALLGIDDPSHDNGQTVDGGGLVSDAGGGGAADAKATKDAAAPLPDARTCGWPFVPARFDPCDLPTTNGVTVIGEATLDTDEGTIKEGVTPATPLNGIEVAQVAGPHIRIERFSSLTLTKPLRIKGRLGLILIVDGDLTIAQAGVLDVSTPRNADGSSEPAPGGDDADRCGDAGRGGEGGYGSSQTAGSGGGGGGGFGAVGGQGGHGGATSGGEPGHAGAINGGGDALRGGCRGGGVEGSALIGADGGFGGGAVQLTVGGKLLVEKGGRIDASGAGGAGAEKTFGTIDGGGGGGSGGTIYLEASTIEIRGTLCANGGGGGESHGASGGKHGSNGLCLNAPAPGGVTAGSGANGGAGGYRDHPAGEVGSPGLGVDGGGGGGGGVGVITLRSIMPLVVGADAVITPDVP